MTIVEFLRARYDEDERAARSCAEVYPSPWDVSDRGHTAFVRADAPHFPIVVELDQGALDGWLGERLEHIARHDPARVLREVEAKRRILARYDDAVARSGDPEYPTSEALEQMREYEDFVLPALVLPYSDHPDYDPAWRLAE